MRHFNKFIAAAFCTSMLIPMSAYAQDAADEEAVEEDDVIIVTATRRAQDVQDIPLAVTAVSPAQLEQQGVVNVQNIGAVSASFSTSQAQNSSGTVVLRIRGVGTTSNNIGFESAVGIFIDGAYQSRPGIALSEFVDVERVEVLRGPQGTLFGRNTSAGALNITNKRPDLNEFGGFVNATYGNFDHISVQGAVNLPIVQDTLALRLTGAYRKRDGFIDVVDATGTQIGETNDVDQYLVRGQLGYESEGGIEARLIVDYSKSTGSCCGAIEVRRAGIEAAGAFNLVGLGPRGGMASPTIPTTSAFDTSSVQRNVDDLVATSNQLPFANIDQWGVTGEIKVPIGDNAEAIYIGSYREYSAKEGYDSAFSGLNIFDVVAGPNAGTNIDTMTHELRVQGDALDGRLNWLVGGYYSNEDITQQVDFRLGTNYDQLIGALFGGAFGPAPIALINGGTTPNGTTASNNYAQDSTSWSVFTHNTFDITDRLSFTFGLRWSDENKDGSFTQSAVNNPACTALLGTFGAVNPGAFGIAPASLTPTLLATGCFAFTAPADLPQSAFLPLPRSFTGTFNDDELIWTTKLGYELDNINLYASFTHGYKSGGFNLDSTAAAGGLDPRFASEEVDAYEIGAKAKFLDNAVTLNIAAFYEEFSNFQVLEFTGAQFQTFNVPKAISKGVEIESTIRPDDNFTLNAALTYTDAAYPNDCATAADPLRVQNLCGFALTNAPELVGIAGATYENEIGTSLKFFLNGQIRMESDRRTSTQGRLVPTSAAQLGLTPLNPFDVQDGNIKINLRAGIGDIDELWGLEAWVTNLTNEITRSVTFNTVLRSTSRSAFIQQPRMYGVTLRGKF